MTTMRGRYVVLEGGEGVGKTTQVHRLARRLANEGIDALVLREPGGDPFAEAGRQLLLGDLERVAEAEVLLFSAMRAQLLVAHVRPALERGQWVLSDRSRLSTLAYQGHGHGVDLDWTRRACALTSGLCAPDLEIVLHVDPVTAGERRAARGTTDRFERLDESFHQRVIAGYLVEAERSDVPVVDGSGDEGEVEERLWTLLAKLR